MKTETRMAKLRKELLTDLEDVVREQLVEHDIRPDLAEVVGCAVADKVAEHWGGQVLTIPKNYHYRLAKRDLEIYRKFTGSNYTELAREYGFSDRAIRNILKRGRKHKLEDLKQKEDT